MCLSMEAVGASGVIRAVESAGHGAAVLIHPAATHQPGLDGLGVENALGELCQLDPVKGDVLFDAGDLLWRGAGTTKLFHVEHEVDLVVFLFAVVEALLAREQQGPHYNAKPAFLLHLAIERDAGGLGELDMPAGQVVVAVLHIAAEQHPPVVCQQTAGDDLDRWGFGHEIMICF